MATKLTEAETATTMLFPATAGASAGVSSLHGAILALALAGLGTAADESAGDEARDIGGAIVIGGSGGLGEQALAHVPSARIPPPPPPPYIHKLTPARIRLPSARIPPPPSPPGPYLHKLMPAWIRLPSERIPPPPSLRRRRPPPPSPRADSDAAGAASAARPSSPPFAGTGLRLPPRAPMQTPPPPPGPAPLPPCAACWPPPPSPLRASTPPPPGPAPLPPFAACCRRRRKSLAEERDMETQRHVDRARDGYGFLKG
ncbi:leucine-rich repeat extensin-like protein 3 [Oryza sativa Japonica Group]